MGRPSGFLIKCRCGEFVPLKIQAKADGDGRFYRVHPDKKGEPVCRGREDFPPHIDRVEDLKAWASDLVIKPEESLKHPEPAVPLKQTEPVAEPEEQPETKGGNDDSFTTFFS